MWIRGLTTPREHLCEWRFDEVVDGSAARTLSTWRLQPLDAASIDAKGTVLDRNRGVAFFRSYAVVHLVVLAMGVNFSR